MIGFESSRKDSAIKSPRKTCLRTLQARRGPVLRNRKARPPRFEGEAKMFSIPRRRAARKNFQLKKQKLKPNTNGVLRCRPTSQEFRRILSFAQKSGFGAKSQGPSGSVRILHRRKRRPRERKRLAQGCPGRRCQGLNQKPSLPIPRSLGADPNPHPGWGSSRGREH